MTVSQHRSGGPGLLVIVCLISSAALAGCSGSSEPDSISPETVRAASTLTEFPSEVSIAQAISVQNCIRRAGFDMPFDSASAQSAPLSFGLSNVFASLDEARRLGYASTIDDGGDLVSEWEESLSAADREGYYRALLGPEGAEQAVVTLPNGMEMSTSKEGCIAEAQAQLYGSVDNALAVNALANEYLSQASDGATDRDAQLTNLVPAFEKCMREQDFEVSGLGVSVLAEELFGTYRSPGQAPSEAEQALAAADFACQEEIDLRGVLTESFAQTAGDWLRANEGKLLAMQEELKLVEDRATTIING